MGRSTRNSKGAVKSAKANEIKNKKAVANVNKEDEDAESDVVTFKVTSTNKSPKIRKVIAIKRKSVTTGPKPGKKKRQIYEEKSKNQQTSYNMT